MAPTAAAAASAVRGISQEAFEALVRENMEDLGMDPDEALDDALQTLTLQGVDLSGIVKCIPGVTSVKDNPVIQTIDRLKSIITSLVSSESSDSPDEKVDEIVELLDKLCELCSAEGSDGASIVTRNGGVELLTKLCSSLDVKSERALVSTLKSLNSIIRDVQSTETFRQCGGPKIVMDILHRSREYPNLLDSGFAVVAAASSGNEVVKESLMDLKVDELILEILREPSKNELRSLYDAIRVLLTPDDSRVAASQVYGYARRFAKIGIPDVLVNALRKGVSSSSLPSACAALKAIAVNDEICLSISENGGIEVTLQFIDKSGEQNSKVVARACCSLLSKLAGSDANKTAIVQQDGLNRLIKLSSRFSEDPSVIQEVMNVITVLSLRLPENAARAIEAGAGDLAVQAMQKFPASNQMQRQACLMIRNLVVRNPENRTILLNNGIEKLIRKAKGTHQSCKDAATAALRDLGLDDYNA
ncbi:armadillo repeat-containing protein 6 [Ananas comosus]|uniref:Armadillo repeat-containing protein 6 n=1 Tax=Ananas comosus TaxID=4615 RepID=A0A199VYC1_ANACO|nr:armadillo repeat-containing protein 6 [Ananas comosus]OAY81973.1 Armadillo repeat-containing protein 6 [Ananas comosus]